MQRFWDIVRGSESDIGSLDRRVKGYDLHNPRAASAVNIPDILQMQGRRSSYRRYSRYRCGTLT